MIGRGGGGADKVASPVHCRAGEGRICSVLSTFNSTAHIPESGLSSLVIDVRPSLLCAAMRGCCPESSLCFTVSCTAAAVWWRNMKPKMVPVDFSSSHYAFHSEVLFS